MSDRCLRRKRDGNDSGIPAGGSEDRVFSHLARSRSYRHLSEDTLRRFSRDAAVRFPSEHSAVKWAKRKLHQSFGAFLAEGSYGKIERLISELSTAPDSHKESRHKEICRIILSLHVSTRERLSFLDELYPKVFRLTGMPERIHDLACGLNPFTLPWMGLPSDVEYLAIDSDRRLNASIEAYLKLIGRKGSATCADLLTSLSEIIRGGEGDLILLLKALPSLERQRKGAGQDILLRLRAPFILLSFPTGSLGGRNKGMRQSYRRYAEEIVAGLGVPASRFDYPTELFYLLDCRRGNS